MRALLLLLLRPACGLELGVEMFKEILNFPLRTNPFFAKVISLGTNFRAEGIEDMTDDYTGNICQHLGNLHCTEGHEPQCNGLGVIDCAGDCAGTEAEFKKFVEVMEDKDFNKKYPELSKAKAGQEKKTAATDKVKEIPIEGAGVAEPEPEPEGVQALFTRGLLKCTNFSQETKALLSLVNPDGGGGIGFQNTSDPNSKTFVDKSALSAISEVEYDYSDLYEEEEDEEDGVTGRELNEETTTTTITTTTTTTTTKTTTTTTSPKMHPLKNAKKMSSKTGHTNPMNELDSGEGGAGGVGRLSMDPAVQRLAGHLRWKRAAIAEAEEKTNSSTAADPFACVVKNMTCNKFPSRRHCTGIALGRCGSSTDMLVALFTPNMVTATIAALSGFIAIMICLSYYCYKLKSNKVLPDEEAIDEEEPGTPKEKPAAETTG